MKTQRRKEELEQASRDLMRVLRMIREENDTPIHKIEGSQAEFDRYIAGDR